MAMKQAVCLGTAPCSNVLDLKPHRLWIALALERSIHSLSPPLNFLRLLWLLDEQLRCGKRVIRPLIHEHSESSFVLLRRPISA